LEGCVHLNSPNGREVKKMSAVFIEAKDVGLRATQSTVLVLATLAASCLARAEDAPDWPQWRGPNRDAVSAEKGWLAQWPEKGPKVLWKANVGRGFSSVAVVGDRVYTMGAVREKASPAPKSDEKPSFTTYVWALDASTGGVVWKYGYPSTSTQTYSTPTVHGGLVYAMGMHGELHCLNAHTGRPLWSKSLLKDFDGKRPNYGGYSCSPLVVQELVIVECGGERASLLALDRKSGRQVWSHGRGEAGLSSPVAYELDGKAGVIQLTPAGVEGVSAADGKLLWQYPWRNSWTAYPTPIVMKDKVFLSGARNKRERSGVLLQLTNGQPKELWKSQNMTNCVQSCVILDSYIYGTHTLGFDSKSASLRCVSLENAELKYGIPAWIQGVGSRQCPR
jgi:outer membrane protein assembly factor BamB